MGKHWDRWSSLSREHPHLHALAADGLFVDSGLFHVMPDVSRAPLEELFRARVITFLVKKGLLPPERARMLRGWTHSGFNIHRSQRVPPRNREDMERLAQYIIRNPFPVDKMQPNSSGDSIIYRSGMNPKIQRNFEVFSPCELIARIDEAAVIERILRHLGLWEAGVRVDPARDPPEPAEPVIEPWLDDTFPDYDQEPVFAEN